MPHPWPVIAQLVPRTWTTDGWMYTRAQLSSAVEIAQEMHRIHAVPPCNVTDDEVAEALRILDAALDVADEHAR